MWETITVGKFQQLYDIIQGQNFDSELDRQVHLLSCLDERPVAYYEAMRVQDLLQEVKRTAFLHTGDIPQVEPKRYLRVGGKVFRPVYDFRDLCAGQFIDAMSIAKTPEEHVLNLNHMLAAICLPAKRGMLGRKTLRYGDVPFDEVAEAMLEANILEAQAIALFFYRAWTDFLKSMPGYLERKKVKMTPAERELWDQLSAYVGGGS